MALFLLVGCSASGREPERRGGSEAATARASAPPEASQAAQLSVAEQRLLAMYDGLATSFAGEGSDCDAMGRRLDEVATTYADDVRAWVQDQTRMSEAEKAAATARLQRVAAARMERARGAMQKAMSSCSENARFQQGLRKLALLNAPS